MPFRPPAKPETQDLFAGLAGDAYSRRARLLSLGQEPRWHRYLVDRLPVGADDHVLDVCTGTGAVAERIVLRHRCRVTGLDQSAGMLAVARGRLAEAGVLQRVTLVQGEAERLPFPDASFDAVLSIYGAMFAPDHRRTATELARVCRPGGRIALASWTPGGFIGETFGVFSRYLRPAPGLQPPVAWGDETYLESLFGPAAASVTHHRRTAVFRFRSAAENVDFFRTYYGPTLRAFETLDPARRQGLRNDLLDLARRYDRNGGTGPVAIVADYLESVIVRK